MRASLILVLPAAFACSAAFAQEIDTDSQRLEMIGTAPSACVLDAPTAANAINASFTSTGTSSGQVLISQFVDPQNANPVASSIELALPVICNSSHQFTVRSGNGGLLRNGGSIANRQSSTSFADFVTYRLGVDWAGKSVDQSTDEGTILLDALNARAGEIALRIATPSGGGPLTAGRFDDTIIVEFRAAN
ncbi:hypothetical protein Saro_0766 [Novosphingobium aromaticivorans DSM 12444]|uniref:Spore coat protein U domain-containing protein n=1 Tax=Novosphingobium aromaticivorans (strain ATCC 700278 / DSM 12444 / CCUG 56034 / CIP 105152 / NBRC 16084 / F199) TaxID=279238 RepID=Q2GAB1_NOVAD|nr:hypothetical protein [Novosphingobium aromaticivorans]ABD25212.1 hypothetical protein Saro_0766 [Novosphingobium aromaticivorans DSM 12444]SCX86858.1 hypothetical protein SAMN05660666_00097 [Novosphingobium aromaticivorans]